MAKYSMKQKGAYFSGIAKRGSNATDFQRNYARGWLSHQKATNEIYKYNLKKDVDINSNVMTEKEYNNMLMLELQKEDPIMNYRKETIAKKNHTCYKCGEEIHKGEKMLNIKPNPVYNKKTKKKTYYKWIKVHDHCDIQRQSELEYTGEVNDYLVS